MPPLARVNAPSASSTKRGAGPTKNARRSVTRPATRKSGRVQLPKAARKALAAALRTLGELAPHYRVADVTAVVKPR